MSTAIQIENYSKSYKTKKAIVNAVEGLNLGIDYGKCVGFIGSNGAGKTTTIKSICGILYPDSGKILVDNLDPFKNRETLLKTIGVVFGNRTFLNQNFTLAENIRYFSTLYRTKTSIDFESIAEKLDLFKLMDALVGKMSSGEKAKSTILVALLHSPKILILDEPFLGIDIFSKEALIEILREFLADGQHSIMITSHDLFELENLLSDIYIIEKGRLIFGDSIESIAHFREEKISIHFKSPDNNSIKNIQKILETYSVNDSEIDRNSLRFKTKIEYARFLKMITEINSCSEILDFKKSLVSLQEIVKDIIRG